MIATPSPTSEINTQVPKSMGGGYIGQFTTQAGTANTINVGNAKILGERRMK